MAPVEKPAQGPSPAECAWIHEMTSSSEILPPGKLPGELLGRLLRQHAVSDDRILIGPGTGRDSSAIKFGESALVVKTDPITFPTDRPAHHLVHVNANDVGAGEHCHDALNCASLTVTVFYGA